VIRCKFKIAKNCDELKIYWEALGVLKILGELKRLWRGLQISPQAPPLRLYAYACNYGRNRCLDVW